MAKKLTAIGVDEKPTLNTVIDGKKVVTTHTVKPDNESRARFNLKWTFDFAKCSQEQILELAEKSIRIRMQAAWRKATDKMDGDKWNDVTFDVADVLSEARKKADPFEKVMKAAGNLSASERAALLKALQK